MFSISEMWSARVLSRSLSRLLVATLIALFFSCSNSALSFSAYSLKSLSAWGFLADCPQISSATILSSLLGVWTEALMKRVTWLLEDTASSPSYSSFTSFTSLSWWGWWRELLLDRGEELGGRLGGVYMDR